MPGLVPLGQYMMLGTGLLALVSVLALAYLRFSGMYSHAWPVVWRQCRSRRFIKRVFQAGITPFGIFFTILLIDEASDWFTIPESALTVVVGLLLAQAWICFFGYAWVVWLECAWRIANVTRRPAYGLSLSIGGNVEHSIDNDKYVY